MALGAGINYGLIDAVSGDRAAKHRAAICWPYVPSSSSCITTTESADSTVELNMKVVEHEHTCSVSLFRLFRLFLFYALHVFLPQCLQVWTHTRAYFAPTSGIRPPKYNRVGMNIPSSGLAILDPEGVDG